MQKIILNAITYIISIVIIYILFINTLSIFAYVNSYNIHHLLQLWGLQNLIKLLDIQVGSIILFYVASVVGLMLGSFQVTNFFIRNITYVRFRKIISYTLAFLLTLIITLLFLHVFARHISIIIYIKSKPLTSPLWLILITIIASYVMFIIYFIIKNFFNCNNKFLNKYHNSSDFISNNQTVIIIFQTLILLCIFIFFVCSFLYPHTYSIHYLILASVLFFIYLAFNNAKLIAFKVQYKALCIYLVCIIATIIFFIIFKNSYGFTDIHMFVVVKSYFFHKLFVAYTTNYSMQGRYETFAYLYYNWLYLINGGASIIKHLSINFFQNSIVFLLFLLFVKLSLTKNKLQSIIIKYIVYSVILFFIVLTPYLYQIYINTIYSEPYILLNLSIFLLLWSYAERKPSYLIYSIAVLPLLISLFMKETVFVIPLTMGVLLLINHFRNTKRNKYNLFLAILMIAISVYYISSYLYMYNIRVLKDHTNSYHGGITLSISSLYKSFLTLNIQNNFIFFIPALFGIFRLYRFIRFKNNRLIKADILFLSGLSYAVSFLILNYTTMYYYIISWFLIFYSFALYLIYYYKHYISHKYKVLIIIIAISLQVFLMFINALKDDFAVLVHNQQRRIYNPKTITKLYSITSQNTQHSNIVYYLYSDYKNNSYKSSTGRYYLLNIIVSSFLYKKIANGSNKSYLLNNTTDTCLYDDFYKDHNNVLIKRMAKPKNTFKVLRSIPLILKKHIKYNSPSNIDPKKFFQNYNLCTSNNLMYFGKFQIPPYEFYIYNTSPIINQKLLNIYKPTNLGVVSCK